MKTADAPFDYINVGGGSAGCVLANRLSTDLGARVALIAARVDTPPVAFPNEILGSKQKIAHSKGDE